MIGPVSVPLSTKCTVAPKDFETREVFNENLLKTLQEVNPDQIVLAGYLVVIPESVIDVFENRIINIHPLVILRYLLYLPVLHVPVHRHFYYY